MSFTFLNQLPTPAQIKEEYPLSKELTELKAKRDAMISDVICGKDDRFLVIIGPCSADNEDSVCDYVSRLTKIQEDVKDRVIIILVYIQTNQEQPARATRELPHSLTLRKLLTWLRSYRHEKNAHPCRRREWTHLCR